MTSPGQILRWLILMIGLMSTGISAVVQVIHDPVDNSSGANHQLGLRTCLWVITQAFNGWQESIVTVAPWQYLRWGQETCVVQVVNNQPSAFNVLGGDLAQGFTEMLTVAAASRPPTFLVAHSDRFGGNVGFAQKRGADGASGEFELPPNVTAADPAENEFAAHVSGIDFEALWTAAEAAASDAAAHEDDGLVERDGPSSTKWDNSNGGSISEENIGNGNSDIPEPGISKRARYSLSGCNTVTLNTNGDKSRECKCTSFQSGLVGRFQVRCNANKSVHGDWTKQKIYNAIGSLRSQIYQVYNLTANTQWPPNVVTVTGKLNEGAVLFVPWRNAEDNRPSRDGASCCERLTTQLAGEFGWAPTACTCDALDSKGHSAGWH
ncbi:uncharacterized protein B0I36DRAFT_345004 [Microdochium trichocladiopsis]|uniref:Uncharacterized protein n=1 Tax=Microdochium trichocladiopsis TaxID=1682393 RepID=A0A9P8YLW4_9PEZI|nr:uncharacterized protein B0I36DRAFT_345004 [Microdochium trichocladiopsis]KAH7041395.1 hypothetical protein B0I36DRAFT_345004 [Microdochium trichocladiopsis]